MGPPDFEETGLTGCTAVMVGGGLFITGTWVSGCANAAVESIAAPRTAEAEWLYFSPFLQADCSSVRFTMSPMSKGWLSPNPAGRPTEICYPLSHTRDKKSTDTNVRFGSCVDGSPIGKFFDVLSFGRCGHVCGLFMRHTKAAQHNAFRGDGSRSKTRARSALTQMGFPALGFNRSVHYIAIALPKLCPRVLT